MPPFFARARARDPPLILLDLKTALGFISIMSDDSLIAARCLSPVGEQTYRPVEQSASISAWAPPENAVPSEKPRFLRRFSGALTSSINQSLSPNFSKRWIRCRRLPLLSRGCFCPLFCTPFPMQLLHGYPLLELRRPVQKISLSIQDQQ